MDLAETYRQTAKVLEESREILRQMRANVEESERLRDQMRQRLCETLNRPWWKFW